MAQALRYRRADCPENGPFDESPEPSPLAAFGNCRIRWKSELRYWVTKTNVLGLKLSDDSKAAARWSLETGGEYYEVGVGTGISGFRANLGVGDDLFGSREDAYSETIRQKRWDWYQDDFSARLKPEAKRILMNTRWHEEDVAGRVLEQIERQEIKGRVISIPAIAEEQDPLGREPGEFLWDDPSGYNYGAFLRARQRETSPMMWAALYQQRPAPEEGDYFKADWLKPYDTRPARETLRVYGGVRLCRDSRWWRLHRPYRRRYRSRWSHVPIGSVAETNRFRRMDRSFLQPLADWKPVATSLLLSPNFPYPR